MKDPESVWSALLIALCLGCFTVGVVLLMATIGGK
jgi:hypothetical protein